MMGTEVRVDETSGNNLLQLWSHYIYHSWCVLFTLDSVYSSA